MIKNVVKFYRNLSIIPKLFFSYVLILSLPIILFIIINYFISMHDSEKQITYSSNLVLSQTRSFIEYNITSTSDLVDYISFNNTIQNFMYSKADFYNNDIGKWNKDARDVSSEISKFQNNSHDSTVSIYMKYGLADFSESDTLISLKNNENSAWYKRLIQSGNKSLWLPGTYFSKDAGENFITLIKQISNLNNLEETIGIIRADLPQDKIKTILNKASYMKGSTALLINSSGELISSSSSNKYTSLQQLYEIWRKAQENTSSVNPWNSLKIDSENVLFGAQSINKTDWKLVLIIPYSNLTEASSKSRMQIIFIFFILLPLMLPIAYLCARSFTKQISKLNRNMKKVEDGNIDVKITSKNNDEIGQLINNFNRMLFKIRILIDEKYMLGREVKNLELKALQAQINPHFLYNTLDLINWMSVKYKIPEIGSVVENLSKFYKLSLSRGEDVVTINNEIEHVKAYVKIQNMRLGDNLALEVSIPDELLEYRILKIILQPFVENSILHGIMEKEEETGIIKISVNLSEDVITIQVEDDGVVMDMTKIENILMGTHPKNYSSYGIKNINERLVLNYGDKYGLKYSSALGKGTKVSITIPAIK